MQASKTSHTKTALVPTVLALVLLAPCAFAKKDLFGNEPGSKQSYQTEQLVPNVNASSSSSSASSQEHVQRSHEEAPAETSVEKTKAASVEVKPAERAEPEKKNSYFETQFARFKGHWVEAKEDLFGSKKSTKKENPGAPQQTEPAVADSSHSNEEVPPELPTISTAEAAQRAQSLAEGQVINVRKYQEEGQPRYAVKLLQKNGRMKTINLDAVSGALIEDTPQ